MADTDALDLLIDCLRAKLAGGEIALHSPPDSVAAEAAAIASHNKVLSLVAKIVARGENETAYTFQQGAILSNNAKLLEEIQALSKALTAAHIPFVVIKGPIQQLAIYGDYFRRYSADIDLLVRARDFGKSRQVLRKAEYSMLSASAWWFAFLGEEHWGKQKPKPIMVDLHRHIHQPGTPGPSNEQLLIVDSIMIDINGTPVPTLSQNHLRLLCTISFAKALYNREPAGAYICDLFASLMAGAPDAINSFLTVAAARGMNGHARVALRAMREIFGVWPQLLEGERPALEGVSAAQFRRMIFTPRAAGLVWPKRRRLVRQYCDQDPVRFAYEVCRIGASELSRLTLERLATSRMARGKSA